jgi:hypothetical protein
LNLELIPQMDSVVQQLERWRGSLVEVIEQISRSPGTLDRHFTTRSSFVMRLEHVGITLSGTSLVLSGKASGRDAGYQATCDRLEELSIGSGEVLFVERFGNVVERHSTFRLLGQDVEPNAALDHVPAAPDPAMKLEDLKTTELPSRLDRLWECPVCGHVNSHSKADMCMKCGR